MSLARDAAALAITLHSPKEIQEVELRPSQVDHLAIKARLLCPHASALTLAHVPAFVLSDRPFEVILTLPALIRGPIIADSIARFIGTHSVISVAVDFKTGFSVLHSVPVFARPSESGSCWIARALIRPASWADAVAVSVTSFTLAGRVLPYAGLPLHLRLGYNHAPAAAGAVYAAAATGNAAALQVALDAGGSTEEVEGVRRDWMCLYEENDSAHMPKCAA